MDVSLWGQTGPYISETLGKKVPEKKAYFTKRANELQADLKNVHEQILESFQALPEQDRYLVSSHEAFNYFV